MRKTILIPILMILVVPSIAFAYGWENETLRSLASTLCTQFSECVNLKCMDQIQDGAAYPTYVALDFNRMDYYGECKVVAEDWCSRKDTSCKDCTTGDITNNGPIDAMNFYLATAKGASGCDTYREMGKAFNYYLQSKEYWHQVQGEQSTCAVDFEHDTEQYYKNGQVNGWTVQSCKKTVTANDFKTWTNEFASLASSILNAQMVAQPTAQEQAASGATSTGQTPTGSTKCLLQNVKYLSPFCGGSQKIQGSVGKFTDPFSTLLLIFIIYFIYVNFFRR